MEFYFISISCSNLTFRWRCTRSVLVFWITPTTRSWVLYAWYNDQKPYNAPPDKAIPPNISRKQINFLCKGSINQHESNSIKILYIIMNITLITSTIFSEAKVTEIYYIVRRFLQRICIVTKKYMDRLSIVDNYIELNWVDCLLWLKKEAVSKYQNFFHFDTASTNHVFFSKI